MGEKLFELKDDLLRVCKQVKRNGNKLSLETEEVMGFWKNILI